MATDEFGHMPDDAADNVRVAHTTWWDALLATDVVALDSLLAADWTFHSPYGTRYTKTTFVETLVSGRLIYESANNDTALVRVHGQTAILTGEVDIQFQWEGESQPERLYYTAVYGWTSPHWRMLAWHATLAPDAEG